MVKKMSSFMLTFSLVLIFLLTAVSSAYSFTSRYIGEAKNLYKRSDYEAAREVLLSGMKKKKTAKGLYWLGLVNMKTGRSWEAQENFRIAVAIDALDNGKLNQGISYISLDEIRKIEQALSEVAGRNKAFKQSLLAALKIKANNAVYKGQEKKAIDLYNFTMKFDPAVRNDACLSFTNMAERTDNAYKKINFYKRAIQFNLGKEQEFAVLLANLAVDMWPSSESKLYKKFASGILQERVMTEIFPKEATKTLVYGPFTKADTDEKTGYITVYEGGDKNVKVGDKIEVIATLEDGSPYTGGGVKVAGKTKWIPLVNGYDQSWVGSIGSGFYVYISEIKKLSFVVKISRKYTPMPRKIDLAFL